MAMEKKIQIIDADPNKTIDYQSRDKNAYRRVAAYCRVSTDSDEQLNSYDQQVQEWNNRLTSNPNYTLIKIYTDKGISGTSDKNRLGFQEMMNDAKAGKFDMLFTKSISRFARNTALTLESIKKLKGWGVEVWFDNENMSSWDPKSEAMFTIMSTMAQEESRHISENVRWTFQKKMKEGYDFVTTSRFLGYDRDPETKQLVINEAEAEIVRLIYDMYSAGYGPAAICRACESRHYKTGSGSEKWLQSTVQGILRNEKYKGDLMLQKTVTVSYLDHKKVDNKGQARKYYIENNHPPIISKEQWDLVQKIIAKRRDITTGKNKDMSKYNARHPLSGRIMCVHCGNNYTRRQWMNGSEGLRFMYQCSKYIHGEPGDRCSAKPISEKILLQALCDIMNRLCIKENKVFAQILKNINEVLGKRNLTNTINEKLAERDNIEKRLNFYLEQKMKSRDENERYYLEGKYTIDLRELNKLDNELKDLEARQMQQENIERRLEVINQLLNVNELEPDMLSIDIVDSVIYKIIAIDKRNAVFVINVTQELNYQDVVNTRSDITYKTPILVGTSKVEGRQKLDYLNYKVVTI